MNISQDSSISEHLGVQFLIAILLFLAGAYTALTGSLVMRIVMDANLGGQADWIRMIGLSVASLAWIYIMFLARKRGAQADTTSVS